MLRLGGSGGRSEDLACNSHLAKGKKKQLLHKLTFPSDFEGGSSFSRSRKRRPWSKFWIIENRVLSYTLLVSRSSY